EEGKAYRGRPTGSLPQDDPIPFLARARSYPGAGDAVAGYFFDRLILKWVAASSPLVGFPFTVTSKSPTAASSPALRTPLASLAEALISGVAGSAVTPLGRPSKCSLMSSWKFFPLLAPIVMSFWSPCFRLVVRVGTLSWKVFSCCPIAGLPAVFVAP